MALNWLDEAVPMLRILISDLDCQPEYTDQQLKEVLIVSAKLVKFDFTFNDYAVSVKSLSVTPDPLERDDQEFINLCTLKAACITDHGRFRARALMEGIRVNCGPASMSVSGNLKGFQVLIEQGPCKAYEDASNQYMFGNRDYVRAVLSPFVSNNFFPEMLPYFRNLNPNSYRMNN